LRQEKKKLNIKEAKITRMNEELDKKRKALQVVEEDLVERKIKIEEEERKLKIIKDGMEQKAKEFEELFKEDEEKLRQKIEEVNRIYGGFKNKAAGTDRRTAKRAMA